MERTGEVLRAPRGLLANLGAAVATGVVERPDLPVLGPGDDDALLPEGVSEEVPGALDLGTVSGEEPPAPEDLLEVMLVPRR
jgi:hypothetical protein